MKKTILIFLVTLLLFSCSKDSTGNTTFQLPPETKTGANTFGVTINGKVYVPRDTSGSTIGGSSGSGMTLWGASDFSWYEIEIKDGASPVGFGMIIHFDKLTMANLGKNVLQQSDFKKSYDCGKFTHIYFSIWDSKISNYAYYGSVANQGEINITRLDSGIFSGNFKGKFVRFDNPNEFITINDGRFDINGFTLPNKKFP
jgi:hypothetical protein